MLSICIVTYNSASYINKCISSINAFTKDVDYELIVVDNNSSDKTPRYIKENVSKAKLIELECNLGFSKANNIAAHHSSGDVLLFINPDTEVRDNAIGVMYEHLKMSENAALGCKLVYPDGAIQRTCARTYPSPFNQFCQLFLLNKLFNKSKFFSSVELDYWDHLDSRTVDCISGACLMIKRNMFLEIGLFDENLFMYSEDADLCYRINRYGHCIYYLASETIIHLEGKSTEQLYFNYFSTIKQKSSNLYFIIKHYGANQGHLFRFIVFSGSLFRIILSLCLLFLPVRGRFKFNKYINSLKKYSYTLLWCIRPSLNHPEKHVL